MLILGSALVALAALLATLRVGLSRARASVTVIAFGLAIPALTFAAVPANAAAVATVPLGTAAEFSVLAGSTVTNTGSSVLAGSVGLSPGSSVTGFPPGQVTPPATIDIANGRANQAKSDLAIAYDNAAGRPINATTGAELGGSTLTSGVYSGPDKSPLGLTGTLTLDAEGDDDAVFIFQTDSTLITASSSTIELINGAQACHVFWQVGSSATLGSGSTFVGSVLALTSITVESGATVHGRALARNGAVTLDDNVFTDANCDSPAPTTTIGSGSTTSSSSIPGGTSTTSSSIPGGTTTTSSSIPGGTTTTSSSIPGGSTTTSSSIPGGPTTTVSATTTSVATGSTTTNVPSTSRGSTTTIHTGLITQHTGPYTGPSSPPGAGGPGTPERTGQLPKTGWPTGPLLVIGGLLVTGGLVSLLTARERHARS